MATPDRPATPASDAADSAVEAEHGRRRLISPAVARAAAERGISTGELEMLPGSGAGGRLLLVDLPDAPTATARASAVSLAVATAPASGSDLGHASVAAGAHPREEIVVALDAHQLSRARRAVEDINASAQLTSAVEVDVTALVGRALGGQQNALPANGDVRALILPDLAAAIVTTLARHPMLNARIDVAAGTVTFRDRVDLGVVASSPRGDSEALIVDAGGMSVERLAQELATVRLLAMAGVQSTVARGDATFMLFDRSGAPILFETPPLPMGTAASLSLGWVERRPLATANSLGGYLIAWAGYLCLTYDHRLVDGADAARFLSDLSIAFAGDGTASSAS